MTIKQLTASRKLWRAREIYRYHMWHHYRYKRPNAALRAKWYRLYDAARDRRRYRDRQLALARHSAHVVSSAGVALVAEFEGFRPTVYRDVAGVPTIGYGETEKQYVDRGKISEPEARWLLRNRLNKDYVPAVLAANHRLTQHQLDGFASFVYNCGPGAVSSSTTVGRELRAGNVRGAADAMLAWCRADGKVWPGLKARREKERALILNGNN